MTHSREQQFLVYLHDHLIGRLHRRDNLTRFVFEPDYWRDPDRPVLGLRFEEDRDARHQAGMRLPPWFSNLLPEGRLRQWIADARGVAVHRETELLAQVGHDLPGAVRVLPAVEPLAVEFADGGHRHTDLAGGSTSPWRFSLAGVGLKFSMVTVGDRLVIPAAGDLGDWIVKLPEPQFPDLPYNELAMMTLAGAAGIQVPELRLVHRDDIQSLPERLWNGVGDYAYAIRRFDRGPERRPIHIEDLAQVRGFYPEQKYGGHVETAANYVYRGRDVAALREFTRRIAFNFLIGNGDAHLKNWSLIYPDQRNPTLAPAYDLVATFPYLPTSEGAEPKALRFGRSTRADDVRLATFTQMGERLGADLDMAAIAREVAGKVLDHWAAAEQCLGGQPALREVIRQHIEQRARQLLR